MPVSHDSLQLPRALLEEAAAPGPECDADPASSALPGCQHGQCASTLAAAAAHSSWGASSAASATTAWHQALPPATRALPATSTASDAGTAAPLLLLLGAVSSLPAPPPTADAQR
jgi:hypothetical protein